MGRVPACGARPCVTVSDTRQYPAWQGQRVPLSWLPRSARIAHWLGVGALRRNPTSGDWAWWAVRMCALVASLTAMFLAGMEAQQHKAPVCHAVTEDSVIVDCDYRDGGWWQE